MKFITLFKNIIPSLALLFSMQALATNYYVATAIQGGNDANLGTSIVAPFVTIVKALSKAIVPGDTIMVRSGTYPVTATVSINKAGTSANHIVLTVYEPDMVDANSRPVFDFSSMILASNNRGFSLSGANYWDIYGIIIKGAGDNGMIVSNTSYTTIKFCSFTRNRDTGLQLGGLSNHINIINCDSYENADLGAGSTTGGGNADGFAPKLDVGDSILFRGCRAWMNSDDGWDGYLRPSNNITAMIEDCWAFRNGYYWLDGSTTSSENGNGFKLGGSDTKDLAHDFTVIKCLAFYNKSNGYDQNSNAGSIYLYNNSAYQNGGRDFFLTSSPVTYKLGAELVLKNNMSLGSRGVSIPAASTSSRTLLSTNNVFSTSLSNPEITSFDTTGATGMRSVNGSLPAINFMHLNPGAPTPYTYIDKGTPLPGVTYHGTLGVPYTGVAPDIGAVETSIDILPVRMLSFTAFTGNSDVMLSWKVEHEVNNMGWTVERSNHLNNASWTALGFTSGTNNSTAITTYYYSDKNVLPGNYYYRLKQIEQGGRPAYSNVLLVKMEKGKGFAEISAYPNPFSATTTLRYTIPSDAKVSLSVYNQQGSIIHATPGEDLKAGTYQKLINGQNLPSGNYYFKLIVGGKVLVASVIKK